MTPEQRQRVEGLAAIMAVSPSDEDRAYAASLVACLAALDAAEQEMVELRDRDRVLSQQLERRSQGRDDYTQSIIAAADARETALRQRAEQAEAKLAALTAPPAPDSAEWWREVAQGLAVEIARLKAERPRCEWRAYQGGPQCTRTAGHGLPHETRSDGTCGARHDTGARCTLPDGHAENHLGEFAGGIAQWPKEISR